MTKFFFIFVFFLSISFHALSSAQMLPPQAQTQMCSQSSIWLQSDACWGQSSSYFPSGDNYQQLNGDPFSAIAALMEGLRGQQFPTTSADAFAGLNRAQLNLWDRQSQNGDNFWDGALFSTSPMINALPRTQ